VFPLAQVPDLVFPALQLMARQLMERAPDEVIGRRGAPYLERWHVARKVSGHIENLYLHRFLVGDVGEALHDHPWSSHSIILHGWYDEVWADEHGNQWLKRRRERQVISRPAETRHAILACETGTVSLFMTGEKFREWGFVTPAGWVHHQDYEVHHNYEVAA